MPKPGQPDRKAPITRTVNSGRIEKKKKKVTSKVYALIIDELQNIFTASGGRTKNGFRGGDQHLPGGTIDNHSTTPAAKAKALNRELGQEIGVSRFSKLPIISEATENFNIVKTIEFHVQIIVVRITSDLMNALVNNTIISDSKKNPYDSGFTDCRKTNLTTAQGIFALQAGSSWFELACANCPGIVNPLPAQIAAQTNATGIANIITS
jgi:hypothetical protein